MWTLLSPSSQEAHIQLLSNSASCDGPKRSLALEQAYLTLQSACAFWIKQGVLHGRRDNDQTNLIIARATGNRMRELDKFLSIMLDEVAILFGSKDHDSKQFGRLHNSARKLQAVEQMTQSNYQCQEILRAIGRISACFHCCSGIIHSPDMVDDITLVNGNNHLYSARFKADERLFLSSYSIKALCTFYQQLATKLIKTATQAIKI